MIIILISLVNNHINKVKIVKISSPSESEHRRTLEWLDTFSYYTDSNIRVPFTKFRFGLSPLIGLNPGIGDFTGLALSPVALFN